jgi:hypothetical protein
LIFNENASDQTPTNKSSYRQYRKGEFEDTIGLIRSHKSKNRLYNGIK